jgi:hypothetical protein
MGSRFGEINSLLLLSLNYAHCRFHRKAGTMQSAKSEVNFACALYKYLSVSASYNAVFRPRTTSDPISIRLRRERYRSES